MMFNFNDWDNSKLEDNAIKSMDRYERMISFYGEFPSFDNAEILNMKFDRGDTLDFNTNNEDWSSRVPPSVRVKILLANDNFSSDRLLKKSVIQFLFSDIDCFIMEGFNYQNSICGMGIRKVYEDRLKKKMFRVDWGGAALPHKVSLTCSKICIEEISDFKI